MSIPNPAPERDYSDGPYVALRVLPEGDRDGIHWSIDAVDDDGGYSEAIWDAYDGDRMTRDEAIKAAPEFAAEYAPDVTTAWVLDVDGDTVAEVSW